MLLPNRVFVSEKLSLLRKFGGEIVTKELLNETVLNDAYHVKRVQPTEAELRLFLREVDYHCPLCGKELQSHKQKKKEQKLFQIAHIYPNSPTIEQYEILHDLERLGTNSEDFENKIALCLECHSTQDYHTTAKEYLYLVNLKKRLLQQTALHDVATSLVLEKDIENVISKLCLLSDEEIAQISYDPVLLSNKFYKSESLLKTKISGYVIKYYTFIRDFFHESDGKNGFHLQVLSEQIRACFIKMNDITNDKAAIFNEVVKWIIGKTLCHSKEACEAVVSFFVQNCEVFYEIP